MKEKEATRRMKKEMTMVARLLAAVAIATTPAPPAAKEAVVGQEMPLHRDLFWGGQVCTLQPRRFYRVKVVSC